MEKVNDKNNEKFPEELIKKRWSENEILASVFKALKNPDGLIVERIRKIVKSEMDGTSKNVEVKNKFKRDGFNTVLGNVGKQKN